MRARTIVAGFAAAAVSALALPLPPPATVLLVVLSAPVQTLAFSTPAPTTVYPVSSAALSPRSVLRPRGAGSASLARTVSTGGARDHDDLALSLRMSGDGEKSESGGDETPDQSTDSASGSADKSSTLESASLWSVRAVLLAAFLNLLGFTMAGPITPALGRHFDLGVGASFGSLTSAYPLGMLLGLFLWPALSDRIGRKPVMAASLLGSGLGLAAQAHAISAGWGLRAFLAARVLTGSFAGSSPVSKAYLADLGMAAGELPRYLAWRDAASTLSFIAGPALGGIFFEARRRTMMTAAAGTADAAGSLAFVIGVASAASLAAAALVALLVRELPTDDEETSSSSGKDAAKDNTAANSKETAAASADFGHVSCPLGVRLWTGVATVCVVSFLFNVGDSTFHAFFPALMRDKLGLDTGAIGFAFTAFACLSFAVSAGVTSGSMKRFGPVPTCAAGLSCVGAGLLGLSLGSGGLAATTAAAASTMVPAAAFAAAALYYCGVPLYGPTVPTMLLRCVPPHRRGAVMGLDGAINTVARVISPLLMGELYQRRGSGAAFGAAAAGVLSAAVLAVGRRLLVMRKKGESVATNLIYKEAKEKK